MSIFDGNVKKLLADELEKNASLAAENLSLNNKINVLEEEIATKKNENNDLTQKILDYKKMLSGEEDEILTAEGKLNSIHDKINVVNDELLKAQTKLHDVHAEIEVKEHEMEDLNKQYIILDDKVLLQSFGFYSPQYNYVSSEEYKKKINDIRKQQEEIVKAGKAAVCTKIWSVNGSAKAGMKFAEDSIKQIIRTFNIECDDSISKVKFSNFDSCKKRIQKSFESLNKLNATNKIEIQDEYLQLKYIELQMVFECAQKVQEEKEELRQQREQHREELRLAKELEEKRAEAEKEQEHYTNAMLHLQEQISSTSDPERLAILRERELQIKQDINNVEDVLKDLDYREANQKAGYVYIISNIGAFGENVYKIGMTRRLEPQDRIDELGGASVPFNFDVHAMIFSEDAPALEAALHRAFDGNKVNAINGRKEFFKVSLKEIEDVVRTNHDKTVEFKEEPEAQQYRESMKIRGNLGYPIDNNQY